MTRTVVEVMEILDSIEDGSRIILTFAVKGEQMQAEDGSYYTALYIPTCACSIEHLIGIALSVTAEKPPHVWAAHQFAKDATGKVWFIESFSAGKTNLVITTDDSDTLMYLFVDELTPYKVTVRSPVWAKELQAELDGKVYDQG